MGGVARVHAGELVVGDQGRSTTRDPIVLRRLGPAGDGATRVVPNTQLQGHLGAAQRVVDGQLRVSVDQARGGPGAEGSQGGIDCSEVRLGGSGDAPEQLGREAGAAEFIPRSTQIRRCGGGEVDSVNVFLFTDASGVLVEDGSLSITGDAVNVYSYFVPV